MRRRFLFLVYLTRAFPTYTHTHTHKRAPWIYIIFLFNHTILFRIRFSILCLIYTAHFEKQTEFVSQNFGNSRTHSTTTNKSVRCVHDTENDDRNFVMRDETLANESMS